MQTFIKKYINFYGFYVFLFFTSLLVFFSRHLQILFVKKNKIYSPTNDFYKGTTLRFFSRKLKKIIKKSIPIDSLNDYDEIIVIGSGKGVVSVSHIKEPYWKRKSLKNYRILSNIYQKAVTNCPRYNG